jgi:hypothetical protein
MPSRAAGAATRRRAGPAASGPPGVHDRDEQAPLPVFVHISKNAGNTVRSLLRANYAPTRLLDVMVLGRRSVTGGVKTSDSPDADVVATVAEARARQHEVDCIASNLPFGLHRYLDRPVRYFAFLREPVSRCVSQWYFSYAGKHDGGATWASWGKYDYDVERILDSGIAPVFMNDQVRIVTGSGAAEIGPDDFELARELIEHRYEFVGASERFDDCLAVLARELEWTTVSYTKQNIGRKSDRTVLPRGAEAAFREANEWDARLHEWLVRDYLPRRLERARSPARA